MAKFTENQIEELKKSKYVKTVTVNQVIFTNEFRSLALSEWKNGMSSKSIFETYGLRYSLLGKERITSCIKRWRKQENRPNGFQRVKGSGRPKDSKFATLEEENKYLKEQLEYQKQEIEFLKKLDALEQQYHRKSQRKKNSK